MRHPPCFFMRIPEETGGFPNRCISEKMRCCRSGILGSKPAVSEKSFPKRAERLKISKNQRESPGKRFIDSMIHGIMSHRILFI